jgi:phosphosulfolactate synthase
VSTQGELFTPALGATVSDELGIALTEQMENTISADAGRTAKPRATGITMILVFDIANFGPKFVAPYSKLVDKVKIMDTLWHDDTSMLFRAIREYRELDITVSCGGTQFELAVAHDSVKDYIQFLKAAGIDQVEVEHHADQADNVQLREEVDMFKQQGFHVIGEVGKKWAWKDPTRTSRDTVHVDRTVEAINTYIDAGADYVYWEGAVVCGLIGRQLENLVGQEQLLEVVKQVDLSKLIFEVYDRRNQPLYPMLAWLVQQFGPNVNFANIDPWTVKRVEWIRHGIIFEMDHPYMRWKADPTAAEHWWELRELPDYSIDVQRPYGFSD